jgi:sugar phosphate isomerase/epimerase
MLFGAMNFPVKPFMSELESIFDMGFDYLELTMDPPQAHHSLIREHRTQLVQSLDRYRMGIVCHLPSFLSIADLTKSIRDASVKEMTDSLVVASEVGAVKVVLHPWYVTGLGALVVDQTKQYGLDGIEVIAEKADQLGLTLCLENLFPQTGSLAEPDDFVEILHRFPTLKLTLDLGHAHIGRNRKYRSVEFIERFGDRITHIHASDNFGKEDSHLPIGAGNINFRKIVKALRKIGYDQTVTLEVFSRDKGYLKDSRDKLATLVARAS